MSIFDSDGPPSWSLDASQTWGRFKMPVGSGGGGHGERKKIGRL